MKFTYLCLGKDMQKHPKGFTSGGSWVLFKCFVENNGKYGEFYLNLDMKSAEGEIVLKDISYADPLISAFSNTMKGREETKIEHSKEFASINTKSSE